ncbi:MAG: LLM class flavin-dependent oxidoreductase [Acidimicrobiaceae bacterium]|nr:LLM class flavin-dependent oxidoreductase [Acidimicrobiaceae bacterium]MYF42082.1 LLM class flavin-dependent oxidoreductase [Acidimicrobiaceae bacterium]
MSVRWGVWFEPTQPVRRLVELARLGESLGAEACFVADEGTERDVYVALTAIVEATGLKVAPAITNPFSRHPVATAAAIATLAELAPGRVMHGLGVGGSRVLQPLGMEPERPFTALRETFELNRRLLAGETVGEASLPWFRPNEPMRIAVAGRGPRVQRLAAEHSDCAILSAAPPADLPAFAERIRATGSAEIAWSAYLAYNDTERRRVLPHFSYMAVDAPAEVRAADGLDDATTEEVRRLMLAGRMHDAARLLPDALVDRYGVAGTPAEVSAQIGELRDCFDIFMLPMNDEATSADHIRASAEIFAAA